MVSYYNPLSMYQKSHTSNLPYAPSHSWYPTNYPPSHHTANGQYLSAGSGNGNGVDGGDPAAASAMYFNPHHHHHMFHQASPDWGGHDNFGPQNSPLLPTPMGPSATGGLSDGAGIGNHLDHMAPEDLNNVPPSPPITVNSGCSEMSSPSITNGGGSALNDSSSPRNSSASRPPNSKSPYEWMKKQSYQSQPSSGLYTFRFALWMILAEHLIYL